VQQWFGTLHVQINNITGTHDKIWLLFGEKVYCAQCTINGHQVSQMEITDVANPQSIK
jgi:hypothetical protein